MLRKLLIRNYALIDSLDIEFDDKLNIITGETGAGKSIIMGALGLILGNRVEGKYVFNEGSKCIIEGYFDIRNYALKDLFDEQDLDYEAETIIRREISAEGKSRAFVNDSPVTLQVLKSLSERLIDIHSQQATTQINTEDFQFLVLDSVANNADNLSQYKTQLKGYKTAVAALRKLEEQIAQSNAELDYNQFVVNELDAVQLTEGEVEELEAEQLQLENAEDIKRGLLSSIHLLEESEQSVLQSLRDTQHELQRISNFLPAGDDLLARLNSNIIEMKDIAAELVQQEQTINVDEERLQFVTERLSTLYSLVQKYRVADVSELIVFGDSLREKIKSLNDQEEEVARLTKDVAQYEKATREVAQIVSDKRKSVLAQIKEEIEQTLQKVGMPNAVLQIELTQSEQFHSQGIDKVNFLFSANKGQTPQPIHKVASGGELSRVMLAVKSLVARSSALPTIIFDEIDTGISGEVALQVGDVMDTLAAHMQVIAITHLPQIASKGKRHFKVYKEDQADRTLSRIEALASDERIVEIAKMLSGANPGDAALQHAKELIAG
ncbi:DNA repair protein RecN [Sphingobacterium corticibacter]|uniref:DNA repair protein RecN n=1 Tax=Sphingobacterium corticibacter TaxID=2171749 RepID=A0A2T8HM55_9SPHI|nr:DNA repair protein RecN [Sphingobacterium corticibacter]PVH26382.1 DNA repair protein RecN [Sphingobacterium corticibacter]